MRLLVSITVKNGESFSHRSPPVWIARYRIKPFRRQLSPMQFSPWLIILRVSKTWNWMHFWHWSQRPNIKSIKKPESHHFNFISIMFLIGTPHSFIYVFNHYHNCWVYSAVNSIYIYISAMYLYTYTYVLLCLNIFIYTYNTRTICKRKPCIHTHIYINIYTYMYTFANTHNIKYS